MLVAFEHLSEVATCVAIQFLYADLSPLIFVPLHLQVFVGHDHLRLDASLEGKSCDHNAQSAIEAGVDEITRLNLN